MKSLYQSIAAVLVLGTLTACGSTATATTTTATPKASQASVRQVTADAKVKPVRMSTVSFQTTGTVAEVLVTEGNPVKQNAPLAQLNTNDLKLSVAAAEASVNEAHANYDKIAAGATKDEIAAASALVEQSAATVRQVEGSVTKSDIQAAREQLAQAQASLAAIGNGGDTPAVRAAQAQLVQAQAQLQAQRDTLSRSKTRADATIANTVQSLTKAQAAYAEAKSNWNYILETGNDPHQPEKQNSAGKTVDNKLEDVQREQYYAVLVQTEASLRQAEQAVQQSQVDAEEARKTEVTGIQLAEAQVASVQTVLDQLVAGGAAAARAAARAAVANAQANVNKLTGAQRAGEVAAANATTQNAQANLAKLTAPTREVDLAVAQAAITSAEVRLQQAKQNLEKATLRAPFDGTIAQVNLDVGQEIGGSGSATVVMGDFSGWKIETDGLTERDVVRFVEGAAAQISFDALPDVRLNGKVTTIQPLGQNKFGDMTYIVTIKPDTWDNRLRWNMSANVSIQAQ